MGVLPPPNGTPGAAGFKVGVVPGGFPSCLAAHSWEALAAAAMYIRVLFKVLTFITAAFMAAAASGSGGKAEPTPPVGRNPKLGLADLPAKYAK